MSILKNKKVIRALVGLLFAIFSAYGLNTSPEVERLTSSILVESLGESHERDAGAVAEVDLNGR